MKGAEKDIHEHSYKNALGPDVGLDQNWTFLAFWSQTSSLQNY